MIKVSRSRRGRCFARCSLLRPADAAHAGRACGTLRRRRQEQGRQARQGRVDRHAARRPAGHGRPDLGPCRRRWRRLGDQGAVSRAPHGPSSAIIATNILGVIDGRLSQAGRFVLLGGSECKNCVLRMRIQIAGSRSRRRDTRPAAPDALVAGEHATDLRRALRYLPQYNGRESRRRAGRAPPRRKDHRQERHRLPAALLLSDRCAAAKSSPRLLLRSDPSPQWRMGRYRPRSLASRLPWPLQFRRVRIPLRDRARCDPPPPQDG